MLTWFRKPRNQTFSLIILALVLLIVYSIVGPGEEFFARKGIPQLDPP